jgi:hypothetical protein
MNFKQFAATEAQPRSVSNHSRLRHPAFTGNAVKLAIAQNRDRRFTAPDFLNVRVDVLRDVGRKGAFSGVVFKIAYGGGHKLTRFSQLGYFHSRLKGRLAATVTLAVYPDRLTMRQDLMRIELHLLGLANLHQAFGITASHFESRGRHIKKIGGLLAAQEFVVWNDDWHGESLCGLIGNKV